MQFLRSISHMRVVSERGILGVSCGESPIVQVLRRTAVLGVEATEPVKRPSTNSEGRNKEALPSRCMACASKVAAVVSPSAQRASVQAEVRLSVEYSPSALFNGDVSKWDTGRVKKLYFTFSGACFFNHDIGSWDTSSVTTMHSMFVSAHAFNQDISAWDTSKVTNMETMFYDTQSFWQDRSGWSTASLAESGSHNMWQISYVDANSVACSADSPPSCTSGIVQA